MAAGRLGEVPRAGGFPTPVGTEVRRLRLKLLGAAGADWNPRRIAAGGRLPELRARAVAEQHRVQAERAAQREAEVLESTEAAAARRRAEEDNRIAAEAHRIAAEETVKAEKAEVELLRAQARASATRRALDKQREDEALAAAGIARERAARGGWRTGGGGNACRVVRMLIAAHPYETFEQVDPERVLLAAGELRQEALTLMGW